MKKLLFILILLFTISTIVTAQAIKPPSQKVQMQNEITKWQILYNAECEKVANLTIANAKLFDKVTQLGQFVEKTNGVLNEIYGKDKKIDPRLLQLGYKYTAIDTTSKPEPADSKLPKQ